MTNSIQIFNNPEFGNIRTLTEEDGTILFCEKDVAGYEIFSFFACAASRHCNGS